MTTQIKITQLVDIGANLATTTLLPVVNMSGVSTTQKTNLGNLGNVILQGAGSTWKPAALANLAYSVANAAQPNITSVGTLSVSTLKISGGSSGQVLRTDGAGNLSWVAQTGGGNGTPGGTNSQVQFNASGAFGGEGNFTYDSANHILNVTRANASFLTAYESISTANLSAYGIANIARINIINTANLGAVGNVTITGGSAGQKLTTDGAGNLSWTNDANSSYGNSNVASFLASYGSNTITTTGNVSVGNLLTAGVLSATGNVTGGNLNTAGIVSATGNITGGNISTTGNIGANVVSANAVYFTGNTFAEDDIEGTGNFGFEMPANVGFGILTDAGNNEWSFSANGTLYVPGINSAAIEGADGFNLRIRAIGEDASAKLEYYDGNSTTSAVAANIDSISIDSSGNIWTFDQYGKLTNPGNVLVNGQSLFVGTSSDQQGFTGETLVIYHEGEQYVQGALVNAADTGSADWVAYGHNGNDTGGWADMGFTGISFNDPGYTITGSGDGYIFVQGFQDNQTGGSFVLATGSQGTTRDIIFATGGFEAINEFARISDSNNAFELTKTSATIKFPDGTIVGEVEGANTFGFYNENANIEFLLEAASNVWSFDGATGNTTLPGTLWAKASDNGSIVFSNNGTDIHGSLKVDGGYNMVISADSNFYVKRAGSDRLAITDTNSDLMASSNVVIHANKAGTEKNWTFDTTGNLTVPGAIITASNSKLDLVTEGVNTAYLTTTTDDSTALWLTATNAQLYANADVGIAANVGGTSQGWTFSADGNLTLPLTILDVGLTENAKIRSQRKIIPPFHWSAEITGTTPTVVYTVTNNSITSMKVTMQIQHTGLGMELFDVYATMAGADTFYTVSNRVAPPTIDNSNVVVDLNGSNEMQITITINSGAANSWVTYDSTEFGIPQD
jgi:hypothetical protein